MAFRVKFRCAVSSAFVPGAAVQGYRIKLGATFEHAVLRQRELEDCLE